jgi:citrate synthase
MLLEDGVFEKVKKLALASNKIPIELIREKRIVPGLRYEDGTGVVVGITSKGQVIGHKRDDDGTLISIPGKLVYCGYDIEDIVKNIEKEDRFGFEETVYLLLTGELPTKSDLKRFTKTIEARRKLSNLIRKKLPYKSKNEDLMGALHTAVSAIYISDENPNSTDIKDITRQCIDLIAKFPTIVAYSHNVLKAKGSKVKFVNPKRGLSTAENFLYMLTGKVPDRETAKIFDIALILHAEHGGGNNSTFSTRCVSSSGANTYMSICAGIGSLSGRLHGGANEAVVAMMDDIKQNVKDWEDGEEISKYLQLLLDKKAGDKTGLIYGIGHAVYTVSDPRVAILQEKAEILAKKLGREKEFELYKRVAALAPKIVNERKGKTVCINVDFYSGFVYEMLEIPKELYTPIFAMSRVSGWSAHRIEEIIQGKLIRPAYEATYEGIKDYVPLKKRK